MKKLKGFTLVELLVVIAIIAILATVVTLSVSSNTTKAKNVSALQTLDSVQSIAVICVDGNSSTLVTPNANGTTNVCTDLINTPGFWPDITANASGWVYGTAAADNAAGSSTTSFKFTAIGGGVTGSTAFSAATVAIQCDNTKCLKKGW